MEKAAAKSVDEYLARVPEPARTTLKKIRAIIRAAAPKGAVEKISYRIPMYTYNGMLIGFAAFAGHGSLFPGRLSALGLGDELSCFETSEGTIRFPFDRPPSAALIGKLIFARVEANGREAARRQTAKAKKAAAKPPAKKRPRK